jgi:hypothetical protein
MTEHNNTETAIAKLVFGSILLLLYGLLLLAISGVLFVFMQNGGFSVNSTANARSDFTEPIIALIAGLNFTIQALWLFKTNNKRAIKFGFCLALCIVQTPIFLITPARLGIDALLTGLISSDVIVAGLYVSVALSIVASLLLWVVLLEPIVTGSDYTQAKL